MGPLPTLIPPSGLVIRTYPGSAIPLVVIKLFENVAIPALVIDNLAMLFV